MPSDLLEVAVPSEDENKIVDTEEKVDVIWGGENHKDGTLYVAENSLVWRNASSVGFSLLYPDICLHAVCKDSTEHAKPHLYFITNVGDDDDDNTTGVLNTNNDADDDDDGEQHRGENGVQSNLIRLVPDNYESLSRLFDSIAKCQALHPDPDQIGDDEDDFVGEDEAVDGEDEDDDDEVGGGGDVPVVGKVLFDADGQLVLQNPAVNGHDIQASSGAGDGNKMDHDGQFEDA